MVKNKKWDEWVKKHPEKVKEYKKNWRERNLKKVKKINKNWQKKNKFKRTINQKKYSQKHPEIINAHSLSQHILLGSFCAICGNTKELEKHHPNYSQPKLIITLCKKCHTKIHRR